MPYKMIIIKVITWGTNDKEATDFDSLFQTLNDAVTLEYLDLNEQVKNHLLNKG